MSIETSRWLEEYINRPIEIKTKEDAEKVLRRCGAIDEEGNIKHEYADLIVKQA